jgi:hypothetical protein
MALVIVPNEVLLLLGELAPVFTRPTSRRVALLLMAAILTTGRRTVANLLRTLGALAPGHRTRYQRVLSHAQWSGLHLACVFTRFLFHTVLRTPAITLVGDDTVDGHKGKKVFGKGRHRDPVRSTHSYTAWRYGHKWVVLCVLVRFPGATRPWALPILVDLYLSPEWNRRHHRHHRTPAQLMCRLLRLLLRWFPHRRWVFVGDSGYGSHEVARLAHQHRERLTLVSKLHPQANLYAPPPKYRGQGRPRVKGRRLAKPHAAVAKSQRQRLKVGWYGGGTRRVEVVSRTGHWYKTGQPLVPIRWVFVHDCDGTHRDEYFFSTDPHMLPQEIIGYYTARWNIETTFQELRSHLGLETTRGWCRNTIRRTAPCLFGLYTVVALLFQRLPYAQRSAAVSWPGKVGITFSDALTAVRCGLWAEWVFPQASPGMSLQKLPKPLRKILFTALAPAA